MIRNNCLGNLSSAFYASKTKSEKSIFKYEMFFPETFLSNSAEFSAKLATSRLAKVLIFSHRVWGHILAGKVDSDENCTHSPQIYYRDRTEGGERERDIKVGIF